MTYKLIDYERLKAFSEKLKTKYATKSDLPKKLADLQDDENHRLITDADKAKINNSIKEITLFHNTIDETYLRYLTHANSKKSILIPYANTKSAGLMSTADKQKLDGIKNGANKITKLSELENDKTFKTESEIQSMIEKASSLKKEVVTSLPTAGKDDVIYLVKDDKGKDNNNYLEYLWLNGKYELIGSTQVDLSGYAKQEDILASKIIDKYVLTKDFRTALNDDQDFLQAIKRDMFTLVIFDGSASDELAEQAGFESILYYKGQVIGISLMPTGDVISPDFVKQNQFKPNETYITSDLMKDYNQVIQEQFVDLQSSLKQYIKNWLNRKLNVEDIREFTQQELEEAFR